MGSIMEIMVKHSQLHQITFKFKFIKRVNNVEL